MDLEKMFGPLPELPPQPPVLEATHVALVSRLRDLAGLVTTLADNVERYPWGDRVFDELNVLTGRALDEAGAALATFRATRDCGGRS